MSPRLVFLLLLMSTLLHGCAAPLQSTPSAPFEKDVFTLEPPEENALADIPILTSMIEQIDAQAPHELHALLVWHKDKLLIEKYANGYTSDTPHDIRSATKSITGLLTGMAIEEGLLSLEEPLTEEDLPFSVQDLLTMSSGKDCNDRDFWSPGNEEWMYLSPHWARYFYNLAQKHTPGTRSRYCTGGVVALGDLMARRSQGSFEAFADRRLFAPLGINNYRWATYANGEGVDTGGHLEITARGLLRIGQFILAQGKIPEENASAKALLNADWIVQSGTPRVALDQVVALEQEEGKKNYGYLWWLEEPKHGLEGHQIMMARGNGGQNLYIVPEAELVTVTLTGYYNSPKAQISDQLFFRGIWPALNPLSGSD